MRWTQSHMEGHFGEQATPIPEPSLGLVNKVVRYLRDEAFIEHTEGGGFRLREPVKLLFAWRDAYRFGRHERRDYFTLCAFGNECAVNVRALGSIEPVGEAAQDSNYQVLCAAVDGGTKRRQVCALGSERRKLRAWRLPGTVEKPQNRIQVSQACALRPSHDVV
jgi:hypothetical protein